ncbi:MAG: PEP/pyruvate-binding domain-containing protein [Acidithiobacillales bacterium]
MGFLGSVFRGGATSAGDVLRRKYASFRRLLATNNEILELIADLEGALADGQRIPNDELLSISRAVTERTGLMVDDLNTVADGRYRSLRGNVERIAEGLEGALRTVEGTPVTAACLPLEKIDRRMADVVGGKTANLGEVRNVVGLPVPPGFAITAFAYRSFVAGAGIQERLTALWKGVDWEDLRSVHRAAAEMQALVLSAEIPQDVREAITLAAHDLYRQAAGHHRVSLRSSAIGEDSHASFAGQYSSFLNVPLEQVLRRYKETVASKFGARALFYMHSKGFREVEIAMSVGCFQMVEARAAGVAYTVDPNDPDRDDMTVAAVWGLGKPVVDGSMTPDIYFVPRRPEGRDVRRQVVRKPRRVVFAREEGVVEEDVPPDLQERPCLEDAELERLAGYLRALEAHYRVPQDVEWVLDTRRRLFILQTRPLALPEGPGHRETLSSEVSGSVVLLSRGATACPGVGVGVVFPAETDEELAQFPPGGVLVARQNSPRFVNVMTRAAAIVTDVGSVTGHMASLAREYGVPTICDAGSATSLPAGLEVTVDATGCTVYRGRIEELVRRGRVSRRAQRDAPALAVQERVTSRIAHLNLTDPSKNSFRAKNCTTFHDVVRFCHEMAISEMFHINDYSNLRERGMAFRLETDIPLGIYVIDLGDGVESRPGDRSVTPEQVTSVPMRALWRGITAPGMRWAGARPIDVEGFLSVMASTVADGGRGERGLGDNSYAMVGSRYVNFGSRLGYHFTTLEAVCSESVHENYIVFRFRGGAAELQRRERRVRFIADVLAHHGFEVDRRQDLLNAWVKKLPREAIESRLEMLGRLMACVRSLDVFMHADVTVGQCVDAFLAGRNDFFDFEIRPGRAADA